MPPTHQSKHRTQWLGIGRAVGGAVVFGMPLMMTMEMWWLGLFVDPLRLLVLVLISLPVLVGVSSVIGFKDSRLPLDNIIDVFVAYAFGFVVSGIVLYLFHEIGPDKAAGINFRSTMLQAIPASLGALLARSELGSGEHDRAAEKTAGDRLVVLTVGALFLALNVAPTEEIRLITYQMTPWHLLALFMVTLLIMYIFSYASSTSPKHKGRWASNSFIYLARTCTAFVVALLTCVLMLWVFGHTDGLGPGQLLAITIVLLFPAGIGAAAARLII